MSEQEPTADIVTDVNPADTPALKSNDGYEVQDPEKALEMEWKSKEREDAIVESKGLARKAVSQFAKDYTLFKPNDGEETTEEEAEKTQEMLERLGIVDKAPILVANVATEEAAFQRGKADLIANKAGEIYDQDKETERKKAEEKATTVVEMLAKIDSIK